MSRTSPHVMYVLGVPDMHLSQVVRSVMSLPHARLTTVITGLRHARPLLDSVSSSESPARPAIQCKPHTHTRRPDVLSSQNKLYMYEHKQATLGIPLLPKNQSIARFRVDPNGLRTEAVCLLMHKSLGGRSIRCRPGSRNVTVSQRSIELQAASFD
jgi:hypothetical protein